MIDDREIRQCAQRMVKRFGADAMLEAAARADELLEEGDPLAAANRPRIFDATARAARARSLGDKARQSLTVEGLDGGFWLARFPQFLAVSIDRAAPKLDIPSRSRACRRHHSPA